MLVLMFRFQRESRMAPSWKRELEMFPAYYEGYFKKYSAAVAPIRTMICRGPVTYRGQAAVQRDLAVQVRVEGKDGRAGPSRCRHPPPRADR